MNRKAVSGMMVTLLLVGTLVLAFNIQPVRAIGTIYIRPDGSVDPSTAPIHREDDLYTLTDNILSDTDGVVVERNNIIIDGAGYTLQGSGSGNGFYWSGINNVTIKNTNIKSFGYGIYVYSTSLNTFSGNNITANNRHGIWLGYSSNNNISGNNIKANNWDGICLCLYSNYNIISRNNITANNECGIWLRDSSSNIIIGNNITANNSGIVLGPSSNNNISGNNIKANKYDGVMLSYSSNNNIFGNNITDNRYGIRLAYSSNSNSISGNNITDNWDGIWLVSFSNDNSIYHNNFVDNTQQVHSSDSINVLDDGYPSGGNYWSGYDGMDFHSGPYQNETDSDGIGDTPYIIDTDNRDNYPLMQPYRGLVRNLDTGWSYPTIQEAINNASEGDRIFALSWTYYEHVVVSKTVSLIGENSATTIIDGSGTGTVVQVTADNVDISGFTIQNSGPGFSGSGIYLCFSSRNILFGNVITNNLGSGIFLEFSGYNIIANNTIADNLYSGLYLVVSYNNEISNNLVLNNDRYGIYLSQSAGNTLRNNNMTSNKYNFGVHGGSLSGPLPYTGDVTEFINDIDTSNTVDGKYIYYLINHKNLIIDPSTFPNMGYLALISSTNMTVKNLNITKNGDGVLFANTTNSCIMNVNVHACSAGIRLTILSNDNVVLNSSITSNSYDGVNLFGSFNNLITENNVSNNGEDGIGLSSSDNNAISRNAVALNDACGISLLTSSGNIIDGNTISENRRGISPWQAAASNNLIYHNNFLRNTLQARSYESTNVWDDGYPSGGNYWSDYTNEDLFNGPFQNITGSDGVWDHAYIIDANNKDSYPLVEPWTAPTIPTTIDELKTEIEGMGSEDEIDNQGIVTSLLAKLNVAQKLIENGKIDQAKNILNAFINEVQAQSEKHVTPEAAELLIVSVEYILSHL